jgi:hypothetical protein
LPASWNSTYPAHTKQRGAGNFYAAGYSTDSAQHSRLTIASLTDAGVERWVYRYDGSGTGEGWSVAFGSDDNVYACGRCMRGDSGWDFTVISVTSAGAPRWTYRYCEVPGTDNLAFSVTCGLDSNVYAAGYSAGSNGITGFTVLCLTPGGGQRWVYRYDNPAHAWSGANALAWGSDGNIYATGLSHDTGNCSDFTVISLTAGGNQRWAYRRSARQNSFDEGYCVLCGPDHNVYAAGTLYRGPESFQYDFAVVSLTSDGDERWTYRNTGPGNGDDGASALAFGADGNVYAAGASCSEPSAFQFAVISLTPDDSERWVYRYAGPLAYESQLYAVAYGTDGNIYAAGYASPDGDSMEFAVLSLTSRSGIAEERHSAVGGPFALSLNSIRKSGLAFILTLPEPAIVSLSLYDLQGRRVLDWLISAPEGVSQHERHDLDLRPGVYFLNAEIPGNGVRESRKLVVLP